MAKRARLTELQPGVEEYERVRVDAARAGKLGKSGVTGIFRAEDVVKGAKYLYITLRRSQPIRKRDVEGAQWYPVRPADRPLGVQHRLAREQWSSAVLRRREEEHGWMVRDVAVLVKAAEDAEKEAAEKAELERARCAELREKWAHVASVPLAVDVQEFALDATEHGDVKTTRARKIRVMTWNVQGLAGKESTVMTLLEDEDVDVAVLTETHEDAAAIRIRQAFGPGVDREWDLRGSRRVGRRGGGVLVMVRRERGSWSGGMESQSEEAVALRLKAGEKGGRATTLIAAYLTPTRGDLELRALRMRTLKRITREVESATGRGDRVMVVGDLNLRLSAEQIRVTDGILAARRAEGFREAEGIVSVEFEMVRQWGLTVRNGLWNSDGTETLRKHGTTPDQIWMSDCSRRDHIWTVREMADGSDHWPVCIQAQSDERAVSGAATRRAVGGKVQWKRWGDAERARYNWVFPEQLGLIERDRPGERRMVCVAEAMRVAANVVEAERLISVRQNVAEPSARQKFWDEELRNARKALRRLRKEKPKSTERRQLAREFKTMLDSRVRDAAGANARWWAKALRCDGREAWRAIKGGLLSRGADLQEKPATVLTGAATSVQEEDTARREVCGDEAADEVGRYVARLSAQDWSLPELQFDCDFEVGYAAFMGWRGIVQDRKASDPAYVESEAARGNVVPALMQRDFSVQEWSWAIDRARTGKASGTDEVQNEHLKYLDAENRTVVAEGFDDVVDHGEIPEWKERAVTFLDKASTKDTRKLEQRRGVSLLSCAGKVFRQALARRLRLVLKGRLHDTQAVKHQEGTAHNTLILTQKVGERLEEGKKTYAVFVDLVKAFDTVKRRLLWSRLRSVGVHGRLLQALMEGYDGRSAVGKWCVQGETFYSRARRDEGLGVTQGGVDSSELFALLIDGLDDEIANTAAGSWVGIPLVGTAGGDVARIAVLKHADDTVLLAEDEESLNIAVQALQRWCEKWQVAPNPDKCEVLVFENGGCTKPRVELAGKILRVVSRVVYLGFVLDKRGSWMPHVERRMAKAERWDRVAKRIVGVSGGCAVADAAHVREATAEVSTLYGAEMWAGCGAGKETRRVEGYQAAVGRAVLGVRASAEACGVLTELGWAALGFRARRMRLQLWWKLGRSKSRLMREVEQQAGDAEGRGRVSRHSDFNWWRWTMRQVEWLEQATGFSRESLRKMSTVNYKHTVARALWKEEWEGRVSTMDRYSRLRRLATEMRRHAVANPGTHISQRKWKAAPYLRVVGGKWHVSLLAMVRLDLLPVESERGRWTKASRQDRVCESCGAPFGDVRHFVADCPGLPTPSGGSTGGRVWTVVSAAHAPHEAQDWREAARWVECRWRRKEALRRTPSVVDGPGAGGVAVDEAGAKAVHWPGSVDRKRRLRRVLPTLPTIYESEPLFHVERAGSEGGAVGGASTLARRPRTLGRRRRERRFPPTLPTIHENDPLFHVEKSEDRGASAVLRKRKRRKLPFRPVLPCIDEEEVHVGTRVN